MISAIFTVGFPIIERLRMNKVMLRERLEYHHAVFNYIETQDAQSIETTTIQLDPDQSIKLSTEEDKDLILIKGEWQNVKRDQDFVTFYLHK